VEALLRLAPLLLFCSCKGNLVLVPNAPSPTTCLATCALWISALTLGKKGKELLVWSELSELYQTGFAASLPAFLWHWSTDFPISLIHERYPPYRSGMPEFVFRFGHRSPVCAIW
jgi:hypothetical protein